jgi:MurNAc alpha-1-phosphate uridylyltransferase
MSNSNIEAFIFAAGYGRRLAPITNKTPKPLVKVGGETLIERIIMQLKLAGITDILINVSHLKDQIITKLGSGEKYGVKIEFQIEEGRPKETAGAIKFAITQRHLEINKPIITINADIFTDYDFSLLKNKPCECGHLILVPNPAHNKAGDFGIYNNSLVENSVKYTYSGIGIYNTGFIIENYTSMKLGQLIRDNIGKKNISAELFNGVWHDVGTIERLEKLQKMHQKT